MSPENQPRGLNLGIEFFIKQALRITAIKITNHDVRVFAGIFFKVF
jgi:hypothetical protein